MRKQYRKCGFIHLNAGPVRSAVGPHVLRPMTVSFLSRQQIKQNLISAGNVTGREQRSSALDLVARPDEMVSAKIIVTLGGTPWYRRTGDHAAGNIFRSACFYERRTHAVIIDTVVGPVELFQFGLIILPLLDVSADRVVKRFDHRAQRLLSR